ncbi:MAG TPA: cbb3-type cytochrome c oxidase subunit II [Gemmataceae bacterium]|nr:cbb3-type cytochrome c oxidase subunit II [Gemmataceae bacterium]
MRFAMMTGLGVCLLAFGLAGCTRKNADGPGAGTGPGFVPTGAPQGDPVAEAGPFAAGRKVYDANGCARCHTINGQGGFPGGPPKDAFPGGPPKDAFPGGPPKGGFPGGPMGKGGRAKGPDLAHVGTKHPSDWLIEHVRNPKAHKPQSRMPGYEGKIGNDDLKALGDYLSSLK